MFSGQPLTDELLAQYEEDIATWRKQLYEISWFMRVLNEGIARQANKEENCRGRFWEGRFRSQALLDEAAILTCMAYVDLNPVRACIASTPETSDFTSIQERIRAAHQGAQPKDLVPLKTKNQKKHYIPIALDAYIDLIHTSGKVIRNDKKGSIPEDYEHKLANLGIEYKAWISAVQHFETQFEAFVGRPKRIQKIKEKNQRIRGMGAAKRLFLTEAA